MNSVTLRWLRSKFGIERCRQIRTAAVPPTRLLTITRVACELTEAKKRAAAVQTESGADRVSSRPGDCEWRGGWVIHAEAVISSVTGECRHEHNRMAAQQPREEKGENELCPKLILGNFPFKKLKFVRKK